MQSKGGTLVVHTLPDVKIGLTARPLQGAWANIYTQAHAHAPASLAAMAGCLASTPLAHVWSSGLSGTWEAQPGEPVAVRFTVLDDRSTAVATMASAGRMEVTLLGLQMRFVRAPE